MDEREMFEAWAKSTFGFWIDNDPPRVLSYTDGGCHPASAQEIAMWDALQAARRTTPDRETWISVDERWPDDDAVVLVALWAYGRPDGERIILIARRYGAAFFDEQTGDDVYLPTHWMPLPTAPTTDQGEKS